ncbi:NAD-dependent epimerase/dehydratase family protein [Caballeronia sp. dw_19]|uniref:NAD-dependent epimerase/dehydratase family protein n=1 Tax=Caballeronia sp. dw_19 TaxID=2719791 RepID=UPI001BD26FF5|nr:NAD-dependent epimerase/dehydratase family protein [Caballeronia sp. dw_19]
MQQPDHDRNWLAGARCTVLGANGFIGTNLCLALQSAGATVIGAGRSASARAELADKVSWRRTDLATGTGLDDAIRGSDFVIHLVNTLLPAPSNAEKARDVEENLIGTLRLLELCREHRVKKVIYASSGGTVYGPQSVVPISENVIPLPICSYGIVKHAVEGYLHLFRHLHQLDYVALRIANPFGEYQMPHDQGLIATLFGKALSRTPISIWGDGSVVRDYVYIQDVVDAAIASMALDTQHAPRVFNIGSGVGKSVNDVIESITHVHGKLPRVEYTPGRAADVPVNVLDIRRAYDHLGWRPQTDWQAALDITYRWLSNVLDANETARAYAATA